MRNVLRLNIRNMGTIALVERLSNSSMFLLVVGIVSILVIATATGYFRPIKPIYLTIQITQSESPSLFPGINETQIVPSIPSLMIIGPSKTGTTSLVIELSQRFSRFIYINDSHFNKPDENVALYRGVSDLLTQDNNLRQVQCQM